LNSYSPLAYYNLNIGIHESKIAMLNKVINIDNNKFKNVKQDIELAKQELNIINKIIAELRAVHTHQETTMSLHTGFAAI